MAPLSNFEFFLNTAVVFGSGSRNRMAEILKKHNWRKLGVVVDKNLLPVPVIKNLLSALEQASEELIVGHCAISEPTYDALEEVRPKFMREDLQAIIGIGGGSALDMAKAMAVLVHNRQPAIHYRGFNRMDRPVLPIIAVPTTAGTGSEVTPNASFIDAREKRKMGINGDAIRPAYALLDPELTLSCPTKPTVSAGVDSIVHAVEAYVAKKTNPLARMFALRGFAAVFTHLPKVVLHPDDVVQRTEVQLGAFLSGVALMHSGTGPAAAMSYPLGVHFKVPHGLGGALFLPHVAKLNVNKGFFDYGDFYDVMEGSEHSLSKGHKAKLFCEHLVATWRELGVPNNLAPTGFQSSFTDNFVNETLQLKAALDQNPITFQEHEIRQILSQLHKGE